MNWAYIPSSGQIQRKNFLRRSVLAGNISKIQLYLWSSRQKICIHLIAAIILHRRVTEKDQDLTPASRETMLPSRISIPTILQQIPKEDLDRFLQRYARMNKQFAQAVKLHFASRIQVNSPQQKYHDLIKSMTRLTPNSMGKIAKHALQSLFGSVKNCCCR